MNPSHYFIPHSQLFRTGKNLFCEKCREFFHTSGGKDVDHEGIVFPFDIVKRKTMTYQTCLAKPSWSKQSDIPTIPYMLAQLICLGVSVTKERFRNYRGQNKRITDIGHSTIVLMKHNYAKSRYVILRNANLRNKFLNTNFFGTDASLAPPSLYTKVFRRGFVQGKYNRENSCIFAQRNNMK